MQGAGDVGNTSPESPGVFFYENNCNITNRTLVSRFANCRHVRRDDCAKIVAGI